MSASKACLVCRKDFTQRKTESLNTYLLRDTCSASCGAKLRGNPGLRFQSLSDALDRLGNCLRRWRR